MNGKRVKIISFCTVFMFAVAAAIGFAFPARLTSYAAGNINDVNYTGLRFVQVVHGLDFSLALTANGEVYSWGKNDYLQLGKTGGNVVAPMLVLDNSSLQSIYQVGGINNNDRNAANDHIIKLAAMNHTALALTNTGVIISWGKNDEGANNQGRGQAGARRTDEGANVAPGVFGVTGSNPHGDTVYDIAAGDEHFVMTVNTDGRDTTGTSIKSLVVGFGNNGYGQVFDGDSTPFLRDASELEKMRSVLGINDNLTNFDDLKLYAQGNSTFVITPTGKIYAIGDNTDGRLSNDIASTTTAVAWNYGSGVYGVDYDGTEAALRFVKDGSSEVSMGGATNIVALDAVVNPYGSSVANRTLTDPIGTPQNAPMDRANISRHRNMIMTPDGHMIVDVGDVYFQSAVGTEVTGLPGDARTLVEMSSGKAVGGKWNAAALYDDGKVYSWNNNSSAVVDITARFHRAAKIVSVTAGYGHMMTAIDQLGRIYLIDDVTMAPGSDGYRVLPISVRDSSGNRLAEFTSRTTGDISLGTAGTPTTTHVSLLFGAGTQPTEGMLTNAISGGTFGNYLAMSNRGASVGFVQPTAETVGQGLNKPLVINGTGFGVADIAPASELNTVATAQYKRYTPGSSTVPVDFNPADVANANGTNNFELQYYIRSMVDGQPDYSQISTELAGKYFEVGFHRTVGTTELDKDRLATFSFKARRSTQDLLSSSQKLAVRAWIAVYDYASSGRTYYYFEQVEFVLLPVDNTVFSAEDQTNNSSNNGILTISDTVTNPQTLILDSNVTETISVGTIGVSEGNYLDFAPFNVNAALGDLAGKISYSGNNTSHDGARLRYFASDKDGDFIDFNGALRFSSSAGDYLMSERKTVTLTWPVSQSLVLSAMNDNELRAWVKSYPNPYGLRITVDNTAELSLVITYQYERISAKKDSGGMELKADVFVSEYSTLDNITSNNPITVDPATYVVHFKVLSSLTFATQTVAGLAPKTAADGIVIGVGATTVDGRFYSKTIGSSNITNFRVGEEIQISVASLFIDATQLQFVTPSVVNEYIQYNNLYYEQRNDPRVVTITRNNLNITIHANGPSNTFDIWFEVYDANYQNKGGQGQRPVAFCVTITISEVSSFSANTSYFTGQLINSVKTVSSSSLFSVGLNGENYIGANFDKHIILTGIGSLTPSLATAQISTNASGNTELKIFPLSDGVAQIYVAARYYNKVATQVFDVTIKNMTSYSKTIITNGRQDIAREQLVSELAYANFNPLTDPVRFQELLEMKPASITDGRFSFGELREDSCSWVNITYSEASTVNIFSIEVDYAPSINEYKQTIYVKFINTANGKHDEYYIAINVETHKFRAIYPDGDQAGNQMRFVLSKDTVTYNMSHESVTFAVALGTPNLSGNYRIKTYRIGDIYDDGVSTDPRIAIEIINDNSFKIIPLQNGEQWVSFIIYNGMDDKQDNGVQPHYMLTYLVEVSGIKTVLDKEEYLMVFSIAGISAFVLLLIIFFIRFGVYLRKRNEQKKIIKRNQMIIKMRDKMHQRPESASKQQIVRTKMKMNDPKYAKMFDEMRQQKEGEGVVLTNSTVATKAAAKAKASKKKGGKKSIEEMRAELEAKKARIASIQGEASIEPMVGDLSIDDRTMIDEQIKAKLAADNVVINIDNEV